MDLMAIDLGTSSVKVTVTDSDTGQIIAKGKQGYCLYTPHHGWVESDPTIWWTAAILAIRECLSEYPKKKEEIAAIGLSGQMHGIIPIDKKSRELYNCIMYNDSRGDSVLKYFPANVKKRLERGGCNPLTSMMSAPKLLWLAHNEKDVWKETYRWVMPKDYIRMKLTGDIGTDISDASGTSMMDYSTHQWMEEIEQTGISLDKFPQIRESAEIVSTTSRQVEMLTGLKEGTPVVCGGADMACTALGTGAIKPGIMSVTIGSAGHVIVPMDSVNPEQIGNYYQMCHAIPNRYYAFGPILSGGINLAWFRERFMEVSENLTFSQLDTLTDTTSMGSSGLFFLPYMAGTVIPHSDAKARGAFVGLSLNNTTGDMVRAIMEGVGYACKDIYKVLEKSGIPVTQCKIGEGGSRSQLWCEIIASAFHLPDCSVMKNKDSAPVGATILAGMGIQAYKTWDEATEKLIRETKLKQNQEMAEFYETNYEIYKKIYPALKDIYHCIGKIGLEGRV